MSGLEFVTGTSPSAGSAVADWAMFTFDDTETVPKAMAQNADVYPLLKALYVQGDSISIGVDKSTISVAAGIYEVNIAYGIEAPANAGNLDTYIDNDPAMIPALNTPGRRYFNAGVSGAEALTVVVPVPADDHWLLNFTPHAVGGATMDTLLMTVTRRGDLPA